MPDTCPACGVSFKGYLIKEEYLKYYSPGVTHYSRLIGNYDMVLDRTVGWICPDCGHEWGIM